VCAHIYEEIERLRGKTEKAMEMFERDERHFEALKRLINHGDVRGVKESSLCTDFQR